MRILMVNKFLYPKGGVETYVLKLGRLLLEKGHQIEYFGMFDKKNVVGNGAGVYVSKMDFQKRDIKNLSAPFRIIYSSEARKKIRKVLDEFQPQVVHFNNIQFHLTPSMILEVEKYRKDTGSDVRIIYTAHDYQLVCPSHGLFDTKVRICEKCLGGNYMHCVFTKCIKNSRLKSLLGMIDAYWWKYSKAYSYIDQIICPSFFLKEKIDTQERFREKTVVVHNFVDEVEKRNVTKENYILEFGHLSKDKGTDTLLKVCERMPEEQFVFAGYGETVEKIKTIPNAHYVGFKTGEELELLIRKAKISVCPSECYENCPFAVIESQMYQTPVIGSRRGGIPELIQEGRTGELFEAGNDRDLERAIRKVIRDADALNWYTENCKSLQFVTPDSYYQKLIQIYQN